MNEKKDIKQETDKLLSQTVRMLVVYKPTNETAMKDVAVKDCRKFFEACVESMTKRLNEQYAKGETAPVIQQSDFLAVQVDFTNKTIITSTL